MLMACLTEHSTAQTMEASAIQPEQSSLELSAPNHHQSPMGAQVDCIRSRWVLSPLGLLTRWGRFRVGRPPLACRSCISHPRRMQSCTEQIKDHLIPNLILLSAFSYFGFCKLAQSAWVLQKYKVHGMEECKNKIAHACVFSSLYHGERILLLTSNRTIVMGTTGPLILINCTTQNLPTVWPAISVSVSVSSCFIGYP